MGMVTDWHRGCKAGERNLFKPPLMEQHKVAQTLLSEDIQITLKKGKEYKNLKTLLMREIIIILARRHGTARAVARELGVCERTLRSMITELFPRKNCDS